MGINILGAIKKDCLNSGGAGGWECKFNTECQNWGGGVVV
jgi:hypothetical protein